MQPFGVDLGTQVASIVNLNHSGHYFSWWIFQVSLANLIVILSMVVIFVAAILIPFKGHARRQVTDPATGQVDSSREPGEARR